MHPVTQVMRNSRPGLAWLVTPMQSFFQEDDFTFHSGSEFTEQNPESHGEFQVCFRKPTGQVSGQSLGRVWEQSNRLNKAFRSAITVSWIILKTWNSTILVPSAGKSLFPERITCRGTQDNESLSGLFVKISTSPVTSPGPITSTDQCSSHSHLPPQLLPDVIKVLHLLLPERLHVRAPH